MLLSETVYPLFLINNVRLRAPPALARYAAALAAGPKLIRSQKDTTSFMKLPLYQFLIFCSLFFAVITIPLKSHAQTLTVSPSTTFVSMGYVTGGGPATYNLVIFLNGASSPWSLTTNVSGNAFDITIGDGTSGSFTNPFTSSNVNPQSGVGVTLRLKAGLPAGTYTGSAVVTTSNGQSQTIALFGTVSSVQNAVPQIIATPGSLTGSTAPFTSTFSLGGTANGLITLSPPTGFSVSTNGTNFYPLFSTFTFSGYSQTIFLRGDGTGSLPANLRLFGGGAAGINVPITTSVPTTGTLTASPTSLTTIGQGFKTKWATLSSKIFTVYGNGLNNSIIVQTPSGFPGITIKRTGTEDNQYSQSPITLPSSTTAQDITVTYVTNPDMDPTIASSRVAQLTITSGTLTTFVNVNYINTGPTMSVSTSALSPFTTTQGTPSAPQAYTIFSNAGPLGIDVLASSGFEISDNVTGPYSTSVITLAPNLTQNVVFVRMTGTTTGTFSGSVIQFNGSTLNGTAPVFVSGTVNSATATAPASPTVTLSQYEVCLNSIVSATVTCPTGTTVQSMTATSIGINNYQFSCPNSITGTTVSLTVLTPPTSPTLIGGNSYVRCQNTAFSVTAVCPVNTTVASPCCSTLNVSGNVVQLSTNNTGPYYQPLVCVRNTNGNYCSSSPVIVSVTIAAGTLSVTPSTSITAGQSLTLSAATCASTPVWSTGQSGTSIIVAPTSTTTYTASCPASGTTCSMSFVFPVSVVQSVAAPVIALSQSAVCQGNSLTATVSCGINASLVYSTNAVMYGFPMATSITNTYSILIPANADAGTYSYTLVCSTGAQFSSPAFLNLAVVTQPTAPTLIGGNSFTVCQYSPLSVTAFCASGTLYTPGNQASVSANTLTLSTSATGTSYVPVGCSTGLCSSTMVVTVTITPPASLSINGPAPLICQSTPVTLTATGCNGAITWSTGQTGTVLPVSTTTAGSVFVSATCTVGGGCSPVTAATSFTVLASPVINTTSATVTCANQSVTITSSGSPVSRYLLISASGSVSSINGVFTAVQPGSYTVVAQSPSGCAGQSSLTVIGSNSLPAFDIFQVSNAGLISCASPTVRLSVGTTSPSAHTFTFAGPSLTISGFNGNSATAVIGQAGVYSVTALNLATGCYSTTSVTVSGNTISPSLSIVTANGNVLTCSNPALTIGATGAASYTITGPGIGTSTGNPVTVSQAGNFTVTGQGNNGCLSSTVVSISANQSAPSVLLAPSSATLTCAVPSVTLSAVGTGTYRFSTGSTSQSIIVSQPGAYSVVLTGSNGCTAAASATVYQSSDIPAVSIGASGSTLTCSVRSITLTALSSATGFRWSTGSTGNTLVVNTPGMYSLTATALNGCTAATAITISSNTASSGVLIAGGTSLNCTTPVTSLTATGEGNVRWSTGVTSAAISVSATGVYSVTLTNTAGCNSVASTTVTENKTAPTARLTPTSATITCTNPTVTLQASGGTGYLFSTNDRTSSILVNQAGTYSVVVTGANGCTAGASATVIQNDVLPAISLAPVNATLTCSVPTVTLVAAGGVQYAFSGPGFTQISNSGTAIVGNPGMYAVTVTAANGCKSATAVIVSAEDSFTNTFMQVSVSGQIGGSSTSATIVASLANPSAYTLTSQSGYSAVSANGIFVVDQVGLYTIATRNIGGCYVTALAGVYPSDAPLVPDTFVPSDMLSCPETGQPQSTAGLSAVATGNEFTFSGPSGYVYSNVFRTPGTYNVQATGITEPGNYTLTVYNQGLPTGVFATGVSSECTRGLIAPKNKAGISAGTALKVRLSSNPTSGELVSVTVEGAAGQRLQLQAYNPENKLVDEFTTEQAGASEQHTLRFGPQHGSFYLKVTTPVAQRVIWIAR